jgi:uncharacterized protein YggE
MKSRALASLAALSMLATPVTIQAAKSGEIELHIEATAQVAPDRAVVPITISGSGETEAQARANLRKEEDRLMAALEDRGIDAAKVKAEGADSGKDPVTFSAAEELAASNGAACAAADAAAAAGDAAAAPARPKGESAAMAKVYDACGAAVNQVASKTLLVSLDDPGKIDQLQGLSNRDGYSGARLRPVFSQSDPAAARKKARAEALAKANGEADAYADALGYRVVRIVRVSNARPAISMFDLIGFVGNMESRSSSFQPSWFGATVVETVAIDYVIAPK